MPEAGRSRGDNPDWYTCGRLVKHLPNWSWLPCNLSLYYECKLLVTSAHFFTFFISEGWCQMKDGNVQSDRRDVPVAIWLIKPSIEDCHLIIYCCPADLNYSQLWHSALIVSWKASGSDILISRRRDSVADDQEIWVVDALLNNSCLVTLGVFQMWLLITVGAFLYVFHIKRLISEHPLPRLPIGSGAEVSSSD